MPSHPGQKMETQCLLENFDKHVSYTENSGVPVEMGSQEYLQNDLDTDEAVDATAKHETYEQSHGSRASKIWAALLLLGILIGLVVSLSIVTDKRADFGHPHHNVAATKASIGSLETLRASLEARGLFPANDEGPSPNEIIEVLLAILKESREELNSCQVVSASREVSNGWLKLELNESKSDLQTEREKVASLRHTIDTWRAKEEEHRLKLARYEALSTCLDSPDPNDCLIGALNRPKDNATIATHATQEKRDKLTEEPEPPMEWKSVGKLNEFVLEDFLRDYPPEKFEWGGTFNNENILPCTINGWNGATRIVSITTPQLQGDDGGKMWFGSSVFTRGTRDEISRNSRKNDGVTPEFTHAYVGQMDDGSFGFKKGRDEQTKNWLTMYVRPLPFPWESAGKIDTLDDFAKMKKLYPLDKYEWGTKYNHFGIRTLTVTTWERGIRIHTQMPYPQEDDATAIKFGVASWTCGTLDPESKERFYHRYLQLGAPKPKIIWSDEYDHLSIFVRRAGKRW